MYRKVTGVRKHLLDDLRPSLELLRQPLARPLLPRLGDVGFDDRVRQRGEDGSLGKSNPKLALETANEELGLRVEASREELFDFVDFARL